MDSRINKTKGLHSADICITIYPHYVRKVEKKTEIKDELHKVIEWLTGYNFKELEKFIDQKNYI